MLTNIFQKITLFAFTPKTRQFPKILRTQENYQNDVISFESAKRYAIENKTTQREKTDDNCN